MAYRNIIAAGGKSIDTLPDDAVVLAIVVGDSTTCGWNTAAGEIRSAPAGAPTTLTGSSVWDKWLTGVATTSLADTGAGWDAVDNAMGAAAGYAKTTRPSQLYTLGIALEGKYRSWWRAGAGPDIRFIHLGISASGFNETFVNAATCWHPDRGGGGTAWDLFHDYYLQPAVTDLLAAGKRIFVEGLYMGGGADGWDPAVSLVNTYLIQASYSAFRAQLGADMGLADIHTTFTKAPLFADTTYTDLATVRTAQENYAAATPTVRLVDADDLEMLSDSVHYKGQGCYDLGSRWGATWAPGEIPLREITAVPS